MKDFLPSKYNEIPTSHFLSNVSLCLLPTCCLPTLDLKQKKNSPDDIRNLLFQMYNEKGKETKKLTS
jgi:hypothetical protein